MSLHCVPPSRFTPPPLFVVIIAQSVRYRPLGSQSQLRAYSLYVRGSFFFYIFVHVINIALTHTCLRLYLEDVGPRSFSGVLPETLREILKVCAEHGNWERRSFPKLRGSGAGLPQKVLIFRVSEMPFPTTSAELFY